MTKSVAQIFLYSALSAVLLSSCKKEETPNNNGGTGGGTFRPFAVPSHFPPPHYDMSNNPVTKAGFELGRKIFFDGRMSSDGTVSCGSCHDPAHAFGDHNMPVSAGVDGRLGDRNSPSIANMAWNSSFMWDGGINHIEVQPVAAITNPVEMNETMTNVLNKMRNDATYRRMYLDAFGSEEITDKRMLLALAQFMSMLVSADSKYDRVKLGKETFTEAENRGYQLFQANCASCHAEPLFTDFSFRNNGLDLNYTDAGRFLITQKEDDRAKFKVPSLRNVTMTYPYMHNGSIRSLRNVLDHYSDGIQPHKNLDPLLKGGIKLSEQDKRDIIVFLNTLSDNTFIADPLLADPG